MIFLVLISLAKGFVITPSMTSPQTISVPGTATYSWTIGTAGTYDCTLSSYNGEFSFSSFSGVTTQDVYVNSTFYSKVRLSGTQSALNSRLSVTYQARTYYIGTADSFNNSVTDYLEVVCNDGTTTNTSTTIIGISGGWTPYSCVGRCSNNGNCNPYDNTCTCYYPYYGTTCQLKDCGFCHNGGTCNTGTGICTCAANYYGDNCEYVYCPYPATSTNCNNGYCDIFTGVCTCYEGYQGFNCTVKKCLNDCNEGGVCSNTGVCTCYKNFYGTDCSYKRCPRDCGAYGGCNFSTGECKCYGTYSQKDCMFDTCPGTPVCNNNGVCNYYSGTCECNTGYAGVDCSLVS